MSGGEPHRLIRATVNIALLVIVFLMALVVFLMALVVAVVAVGDEEQPLDSPPLTAQDCSDRWQTLLSFERIKWSSSEEYINNCLSRE